MKKITVNKDNKKVLNFIKNEFNNVPESALYKALRQKDIRVNDVKISENISVKAGDEITIYIKDEVLYGSHASLDKSSIIYDDENIVIINKPKGILVQGNSYELGLDKLVNDYYNTNSISPCHRLDRNTSGIIIFAKSKESEEIILNLIKNHQICKYYKCLVFGHPTQKSATLKDFLFKDRVQNRVIISDVKKKGYVDIITKYTVLQYYDNNTSLLDVELITGRTHQIRAHLAYIGHPIIGDGKYGINSINKKLNKTWQELESYKITFKYSYGKLAYLENRTFEI